jgi:hypothetical protein
VAFDVDVPPEIVSSAAPEVADGMRDPPLLVKFDVAVLPIMVAPAPPEVTTTVTAEVTTAVIFTVPTGIDAESAVLLGEGVMAPPLPVELNVETPPAVENTSDPSDAVPPMTKVWLLPVWELTAPDMRGVTEGTCTPSPAVAVCVAVENPVVNAALPPVVDAATGGGVAAPFPAVTRRVEVPKMM